MQSLDKPFEWNEARTKAAVLVAEDEITDEDIAAACGVSRTTLHEWKQIKTFQDRIAEHLAELDRAMMRYAISKRRKRIGKLQRAIDKVEVVIDERAALGNNARGAVDLDVLGALAPGSDSGLLVSKPIFSHNGDLAYEWKFDAALVREYRALMEQAAKELGQLQDRLEITGETLVRQYVGVNIEDV